MLTYLRIGEEYPCPKPGGPGCPMQVIECENGSLDAVCGNEPAECPDMHLALEDVEVLGVVPARLCEALRRPPLLSGHVDVDTGLHDIYRVASLIPQPGVLYPVYFVARCGAREYEAGLEALRSRREHQGFAVLAPTDRFLAEQTVRQMQVVGVPILALSGVIDLDDHGEFMAHVDPALFFSGIGRLGPGPVLAAQAVVARVRTREGWADLNEQQCRKLAEAADQYDIFVDERTRATARHENGEIKRRREVQATYFRLLRDAAEARGYFDPGTDDRYEDVLDDPKQTFVRAGQSIDIKYKDQRGKTTWTLFKTRMAGKHSVYQFDPDPDVRFALIFLPPS